MIRTVLAMSAVLSCAAAERWEPMQSTQGSVGIAVSGATAGNVGLGPIDKSWSDAARAELYFRSYYPAMDGVQPFFEGALFSDTQNYSSSDGRIDADTVGLSVSVGGTMLPFQDRAGGPMSLGIMPYARFALGSTHVYVRDLEYGDETIDASGSVGRLDFGGGADVRLTLGRHLEAAVGGGINFWHAASIDAVVTEQGGAVQVGQSVDFGGYDVFLRASFGFSF